MGDQGDPGLLQRSLDTIFNSITYQQAKRCVCCLSISLYLFLNQERIYLQKQQQHLQYQHKDPG